MSEPPSINPNRDEIVRVSTLELFFDLVFVLTITQLTAQLEHHPDGTTLFQVTVMLGVIWWMYSGYAWLTNTVAADTTLRRNVLLGGMAAFLVVSLSIPEPGTAAAPRSGSATRSWCWCTSGCSAAPRRGRRCAACSP